VAQGGSGRRPRAHQQRAAQTPGLRRDVHCSDAGFAGRRNAAARADAAAAAAPGFGGETSHNDDAAERRGSTLKDAHGSLNRQTR